MVDGSNEESIVAMLATEDGSLVELDQHRLQLIRGSLLLFYDEKYKESIQSDDEIVTNHCRQQMKTMIQLVETIERIERNLRD
jgi:hypothetical protein